MSQELKLSKAAAKMLQQIEHLPESDILWLEDMALGIASSLHHITNKIENPPKRKASGCDIIYLGSDLFPSIYRPNRLKSGLFYCSNFVFWEIHA